MIARLVKLALIVIGTALLGLAVRSGPAVMADEIESIEPIPCPDMLHREVVIVDGIAFCSVSMLRGATQGYNIATYDVIGNPVSADRRWEWRQGGMTIRCEIWHIRRGGVRMSLRTYTPLDTWGPIVPSNDECHLDELRTNRSFSVALDDVLSMDPGYPCDPGGDGGGGGDPGDGGGGSGGSGCTREYGVIEISYDGGLTWEVWWQGWYTLCNGEAMT
jgi:uncharacterized membrane protein YgcG